MDNSPDPLARADLAKSIAHDLGFDLVGISRPTPSPHADAYHLWIAAGRHGAMDYLARHTDQRLDLTRKFPWARSIISVALSYYQPASPSSDPQHSDPQPDNPDPRGRIARYAWGRDYHRILNKKLEQLEKRLRTLITDPPPPFEARAYVDTGPLLERELAANAGLGWIGKHTLLINPTHGSYFVLGELVTSLDLAPTLPSDLIPDHCGTCSRCIDACPTAAITPYAVDAVKCISYQTLENRAEIPPELHAPIAAAGFVVGCDICQEVCPHNRQPLPAREPDFTARAPAPAISLRQILDWQEQDWDMLTRGRAHRRARFPMWQRNARILQSPPSR